MLRIFRLGKRKNFTIRGVVLVAASIINKLLKNTSWLSVMKGYLMDLYASRK